MNAANGQFNHNLCVLCVFVVKTLLERSGLAQRLKRGRCGDTLVG